MIDFSTKYNRPLQPKKNFRLDGSFPVDILRLIFRAALSPFPTEQPRFVLREYFST